MNKSDRPQYLFQIWKLYFSRGKYEFALKFRMNIHDVGLNVWRIEKVKQGQKLMLAQGKG